MAGSHAKAGENHVTFQYERLTLEYHDFQKCLWRPVRGMEERADGGEARQLSTASRTNGCGISIQPRPMKMVRCTPPDFVVPRQVPFAPTQTGSRSTSIDSKSETLENSAKSSIFPSKKRRRVLQGLPAQAKGKSRARRPTGKHNCATIRVKWNDSLRLGLKVIKREFSAGIRGKQIAQLFSDTFRSELGQMGVTLPVGQGTINWQWAEYLGGKGVQSSWHRVDGASPAAVDAMRAKIRAAMA